MSNPDAPPISCIVVVENDADGLRRLIKNIKPYVNEVIVSVQPSTDGTLKVARELADILLEREHDVSLSPQFYAMIDAARNDIFINLDADETLAHPERLAYLIEQPYDVWWIERIDYLDGHRVQFSIKDPHERLFRRGALEWQAKMHTYATIKVPGDRVTAAPDVWVEHRRTIDRIRWRQAQYKREAVERGQEEVVGMQNTFLAKAEGFSRRLSNPKYHPRILLSYNGTVGIGDTLMTTPTVRTLRAQYPRAKIEYLTQVGVVLEGNPYVDKIWTETPEQWNPEREQRYDIVIHWETSLPGEAGKRLNGYECEAYWAQVDVDDYHPDWFILPKEKMWADAFLKESVKTPRVVGMALSASCLHRTWARSVEFVRLLLDTYPDVTLIFFGDERCQILEMETNELLTMVNPLAGCIRGTDGNLYVSTPDGPKLYEGPRTPFRAAGAYDGPGADRIVRTAGRIGLREAAALVSKLDLLIAPDSGLMHVAGCFDTPCVAYFNLVPPELRVNHMPCVLPVVADYECSPCFIHGTIQCPKTDPDTGAPCLYGITPEMVMKRVKEVLG